MYTIGQMTKMFKLSRSTLLYYDKIGLLKASSRNSSNYRVYSQDDFQRMKAIMMYKDAGVPLKSIHSSLDSNDNSVKILEQRLGQISHEIFGLKQQQLEIATLLANNSSISPLQDMDKHKWVTILKESGLTESDMKNWHKQFEKASPQDHYRFLKSLGINEDEIRKIKSF